jgi:ketosteroid isomerase-like protein
VERHPNVARIEDFLNAYGRGDAAAVGELLADDIVWHVAGRHRLSGDYRGREAVLGYFGQVSDETQGSIELDPVEVMASDRHGATILRVTGDRAGSRLDTVMAEAFRFDDEGRVQEFWATATDQAAIDRFWG